MGAPVGRRGRRHVRGAGPRRLRGGRERGARRPLGMGRCRATHRARAKCLPDLERARPTSPPCRDHRRARHPVAAPLARTDATRRAGRGLVYRPLSMTILRAPGEQRDLDLVVLGDVNPDVIVEGGEPQFGQRELLVDSIEMTIGGSAGIMAAGRPGSASASRSSAWSVTTRSAGSCSPSWPAGGSTSQPAGSTSAARPERASSSRAAWTGPSSQPWEPSATSRRRTCRSGWWHGRVTSTSPRTSSSKASRWACRTWWPRRADPGRRSRSISNWDPDETWDSGLRDLLRSVDLFLPNEAEACRIAGRSSVQEAARALAADVEGRLLVAVKRGVHGALAVTPDGELLEVPAYPVETVDFDGRRRRLRRGLPGGPARGSLPPRLDGLRGGLWRTLDTIAGRHPQPAHP